MKFFRTTFTEFGERLREFAPNILAMLLILLAGTLVAGGSGSPWASRCPASG
jgi:hypothetical protein